MLHWNYRVFLEDNGDYVIREVFYAEDGSIVSCTANSVEPLGRTLEELANDIDFFKKALTLPVLTLDDIPIGEVKQHTSKENTKNISHEELLLKLGLTQPSKAS
jgi:hypothetical protein